MIGEFTYLVPLRCERECNLQEFADYLAGLAARCEVIVVDGSSWPSWQRHAAVLPGSIRHLQPDPRFAALNGKVTNVRSGMAEASAEIVVIADDDIRYDQRNLSAALEVMQEAELLIPQNYFDPAPWHALWDTGRILLNRSFGMDYPGTLVIRRSRFLAAGGYDGDVLFENLELIRTMRADGATIVRRPDLFVRRLPPSSSHFLHQRVRQAYDSFAQPARQAIELCLLPVVLGLSWRRRWGRLMMLAGSIAGIAHVGRRRDHGKDVFPAAAVPMAIAWAAERAVCSWMAVGARVRGGVKYSGGRIVLAAHAISDLASARPAARRAEPDLAVRAVAERLDA